MKAKRAAKAPKLPPVTALKILLELMLTEQSEDSANMLLQAECAFPELVNGGLGCCAVRDAAETMLDAEHDVVWTEAKAGVAAAVATNPELESEISTLEYSYAGASFWLGVVAGMRLGSGQ